MSSLGCSFTGHRRIGEAHLACLGDLLTRAVAYAYDCGCRTFYTGGAVGFDTMAARAVLQFRMTHTDVRMVLLLPCPEQADMFGERAHASYDFLLRQADEVRYICESYTRDCMKKRNAALAEAADILIAYVGHERSGSAQTMRMAARRPEVRIYNLYPEAARLCAR